MAAGHAFGWPIVRGRAQTLTDALARHLESLGGNIETSHEATRLLDTDLILADVTPRQLIRIAGSELPPAYRQQLERFRYGAGTFKVDYALSSRERVLTRRHRPPWWHAGRDCRVRARFHL